MKFADVMRRQVIDLETATVIGTVDDAIVGMLDGTATLLGFTLHKTHSRNDWLSWTDIAAVGPDAITVDSVSALSEQPEGPGRLVLGDGVIGGRVLGDDGEKMSPISQIEFDSVSGKLTHVTLFDTVIHTASDLVGIGTFATILHR